MPSNGLAALYCFIVQIKATNYGMREECTPVNSDAKKSKLIDHLAVSETHDAKRWLCGDERTINLMLLNGGATHGDEEVDPGWKGHDKAVSFVSAIMLPKI